MTYDVLLAIAGLKSSDATIKSIDFDTVKDFQTDESDTVDIYRTDQTYLLDQSHIPYTLIYPEQYGFDIYGDCLTTTDQKIASNPVQVSAFVKASMMGLQYAIDHPTQALTYVAKYQNSTYKDPAYESHILTTEIPLFETTGGQPLGSMQYIPWNRAYQAVSSAGLLTRSFDASQLYTSEFTQ